MKRYISSAIILFFLSVSPLWAQSQPPMLGHTGSSYRVPTVDGSTHALNMMDYEHHEIHAGSHYFVTSQATVGSGATVAYLLYAPHSTKEIHLAFSGTGSVITDMTLIEDVPATLKGTAKTIYNSNRNSSNTATAKFYDTVTGGPFTGTTIYRIYSGAATQQSRSPMSAQRSQEVILKSGTTYCFWFQSGTADNLTNLQLEWYEHTPKPN